MATPNRTKNEESLNTLDQVDSIKLEHEHVPGSLPIQENSKADETDFKLLGLFKTEDAVRLPTSIDAQEYNMDHPHRGFAVIFNQRKFIDRLNVNERTGTDIDRDKLKEMFLKLGFEENQIRIYNDMTVDEIQMELRELAKEDHSTHDCLIVTICTHGVEGLLYGSDRKFPNHNLWQPFLGENCKTLAGKPKIFFIQACKDDVVRARMTDHDSNKSQRIPSYSDFLIVYSTVPGYFSWEDSMEGSLFIQALCDVVLQLYKDHHLMNILTVVNRKVAFDLKKTKLYDPEEAHRHLPCVTSMLTRRIYFRPKNTKQQEFLQAQS